MTVLSTIKDNAGKIAVIAGFGVAVTIGYHLFCKYRSRRKTIVQDVLSPSKDPQSIAKQRLKALLRAGNVYCSDIDHVEEVIDYLLIDGPDQLQVVADFDRTLSGFTHNGKPVPSCHGVVEGCPHLPEWFLEKTKQMKDYYYAIEIDPTLKREEKFPFMVEWWEKAHDLLVSCKIHRQDLSASVSQSNLYLRDGGSDFLTMLSKSDIPLLIFSAGVGDVIEEVLKLRYKYHDNIHIISNWMDFNHEGLLVGFKGETIHVYNKNTHAIENASYFENIKHRHNVILLGDSLGDLDIVDGLDFHENLLTIGFLNQQVEANLAEYTKRFHIVITEDNTFNLINCLLENIILSRH